MGYEYDAIIELVELAEEAAMCELQAFGFIADGEPTMVDELIGSVDPYDINDECGEYTMPAEGVYEAEWLIYENPDEYVIESMMEV